MLEVSRKRDEPATTRDVSHVQTTALAGFRPGSVSRRTFDAIYRDHHAFVWRCVQRLGVPEAAADDVLQEVFVTAYRRLHTFEHRSSLRSWLAGIARRVAFRHRRSRWRRERREDALGSIPPDEPDLDDWLRRREAEIFLQAFLDGLDREKREVFVLCDLEGMRGREAAEALGVNQNTAYSRLRAARELFERACARALEDGFDLRAASVLETHKRAAPREQAVQRSWLAITTSFGTGGAVGVSGSGTAAGVSIAKTGILAGVGAKLQALGITAALGASGALAVGVVADQLADETSERTRAPREPGARTARSSAVHDAAPPASRDGTPPVAVEPSVEPPPVQRPSEPATTSSPAVTARRAPVDPIAPDDPLRSELESLEALQARAAARQWSAVLDGVERHRRAYPGGAFSREVVALVVEAHCRQGAPRRAKQEALTHLGPQEGNRLFEKKCP
jgi:RNA polymerase sigma-70 factor, ECF subfamily